MQTISIETFIKNLETDRERLELIDVRNEKEHGEVHLDGAKLIPLYLLPERYTEIDRSKQLILICKSGGRSGQATLWLESEGILGYNLEGGMDALEKLYPEKVIRTEKK